MEKFIELKAIAAPLLEINIDTDVIIPSREMKRVSKLGLGEGLFAGRRYTQPGGRDENPEFVLNHTPYRDAQILLSGSNFGCGSSREHAVWAIQGANVGAVIAQTFARIFYRNCINCGFYVIELEDAPNKIADGDELDIDYENGIIDNKTQGKKNEFKPLPDFAIEIINDGGLLEHIKKS